MIKVCYVFFGEEIWMPLIRRQALELLQHAASKDHHLSIRVLMLFPIYWCFTKRSQFRSFSAREYDKLEFKFVPLPFPPSLTYILLRLRKKMTFLPGIPTSTASLFFMWLAAFPVLFKYHISEGFSIFHCRSYPASSILLKFKKVFSKVKLIFDPRSDFPEENVTRYLWRNASAPFRFWKAQERMLLKHADITICITSHHQTHYERSYSTFNCGIVPNNVDCSKFKFDLSKRNIIRNKFQLHHKTVFCYLGTMETGSWHSPEMYAEVIRYYRAYRQPHVFMFLVPPDAAPTIDRVFDEYNIRDTEYIVIHPNYHEVSAYLSAADFGLFYLKTAKVALSTKIVEYNSVGLPALVNSNAVSAALYVSKFKTGKVIDLHSDGAESDLNENFSRERIAEIARCHFDNENIAAKYIRIYHWLSGTAILPTHEIQNLSATPRQPLI